MTKGREWDAANPGRYEAIVDAVRTDAHATLIDTSGPTGRPEGVELTHDCWLYEAAQLRIGFSTAVAGRVEKIVEDLGQVKPTFVAAVPRIFEKTDEKVTTGAKEAGGAEWAIFSWAFGVGRDVSKLRLAGQEPTGPRGRATPSSRPRRRSGSSSRPSSKRSTRTSRAGSR